MAAFGPEVFDDLANAIKNNTIDNFIRAGIAMFLLKISTKFSEIREKAIDLLKDVIYTEKINKQ
jgi:hypothetical protein